MAGNRYGIKKPESSVLLAKKRTLALASQEGVEQIQGRKPVQTKMNKGDSQGPHVSGRNLDVCNSIIPTKSKHTKGGENSSSSVKWG